MFSICITYDRLPKQTWKHGIEKASTTLPQGTADEREVFPNCLLLGKLGKKISEWQFQYRRRIVRDRGVSKMLSIGTDTSIITYLYFVYLLRLRIYTELGRLSEHFA